MWNVLFLPLTNSNASFQALTPVGSVTHRLRAKLYFSSQIITKSAIDMLPMHLAEPGFTKIVEYN